MRNPLNKRLLRDIKKDRKKNLVLLLLMSFMIGVASGTFVGNDSIVHAINESYEKYNIENGNFELKEKATKELIDSFEKENIIVYEQFYKKTTEKTLGENVNDGFVRLFKIRKEVNLPCVMEGELPKNNNEIIIDRTHANNVNIKVGDEILVNNKRFKVVGHVSSPDYSALFENNADVMFNAIGFDIGFVTEEAWNQIDETIKYQYAFKYKNEVKDVYEEKEISDDLVEKLAVLCLTGTYTNDKDEADELNENIDKWKAFLEEAEEEANALEERGNVLKQKQKELESKVELIMAQDPATLKQMQDLQNEANRLQKDIDEFSKKEDEINETIDKLEELEPYEDNTNELTNFIPAYANQAMKFATNDLGKDQAMINVLVYIFIAVLAFVFAITTSNKIKEEASVIGTLKATGYTKAELIKYYMMIPIVVTLLGAILGNIFGYTIAKDIAVSLYYNSYSLVKYDTLLNPKAFIITTLIPLLLMIIINFIVISRLMKFSPLKFLRRDLSNSKRKKAIRLPSFKFMSRFRLRILFQNIFDYITLFLGLIFIMLILGFAVGFPETIDNYRNIMAENNIANYQTILKDYKDEDGNIIKTNSDAEIFSTYNLVTVDGIRKDENISVYAYENNSKYIKINEELKGNEVYISSAYHNKFLYEIGDEIELKEKYENKTYKFIVKGIYNYPPSLSIFIPNNEFNRILNNDIDSFSGFLSNNEIKDIDQDNIYTVITTSDITSYADQLDHSMGSFADYLSVVCLLMAIFVIYLLTKILIEKNTVSISMVKVLGYDNSEINSLYILLTTIVVIILTLITTIISLYLLGYLFRLVFNGMEGWIDTYISYKGIIKMVLIVYVAYFVVSFLSMRQIKKIPLTEALKNAE